ncbi:hypothetical protein EW145_g6682 [Phellinidium pouzarii]|uniref:Beta-Casp domain-containing protein n=1 Tax=Phellinidium pouzarii TaxID=167371 RepID=A0A4S4KWZ4_9AGAM|nr:hypothetical protein EW145_g6682 [Phellinidium pouzarii]
MGLASLPFVDELDWSIVDALLVTHFHLDHAASLTYIMEKTNFKDGKGKVYMMHPTKAAYKFMMQDFARYISSTARPFTPFHAGHVLGACMFLINIAGLNILYTGDYSREEDRHLVKAEVSPVRPDVLIVESTYGVQGHEGRDEKELRFTSLVHKIIRRGGHVLVPTFALGRAQELLLILEEYWEKHPDLHDVPIYYVSSLARKCMAIYQTYISILPQVQGWEKKISEGPPCIVLASPGMLEGGPSRELLEMWAPDPRKGLIITGYSVERTMARDILNEPSEIIGVKGNFTIQRRISVDYISFSAQHVDGPQNSEFKLISSRHKYVAIRDSGCRTSKAEHHLVLGSLVSKDYSHTLLDPPATPARYCRLIDVRCYATAEDCARRRGGELVRWHLEGMYGTLSKRASISNWGADIEGYGFFASFSFGSTYEMCGLINIVCNYTG